MNYQLVLQFPAESLNDFDSLVELEDELIQVSGQSAEIDGHDFGSGEANIFILTSDPANTFSVIKPKLESKGLLGKATVAHREIDGEDYTVIWPEKFSGEFTVQ
jgi:hypothetical protein